MLGINPELSVFGVRILILISRDFIFLPSDSSRLIPLNFLFVFDLRPFDL